MKVKDVVQYDDILKNLIDNGTQLDTKIKFRFLNMRKQFEPIVQNFMQMREEILNKHAEQREDGTVGIFAPEEDKFESKEDFNKAVEEFQKKVDAFNSEVNKILEDKADIEFTKLKADDIMNAGIPSDALLALYDIIEE